MPKRPPKRRPPKPKRPRGEKYRGLYPSYRGAGWRHYFDVYENGKRTARVSTKTADWDEAVIYREEWLRKHRPQPGRGVAPPFAQIAGDALADLDARRQADADSANATTYANDLRRMLQPDGPILTDLGHLRVHEIDLAALRRWYDAEIVHHRGRGPKTGENLLGAIQRVMKLARRRGYVDDAHDPVQALRAELREDSRTKAARARQDRTRRLAKDGVLRPDEVGALTAAARRVAETIPEAEVVVLGAVECGPRHGELAAWRWGDVDWGTGEDDPKRAIHVRRTTSRGESVEAPKSGKARRPHISRRLRRALLALHARRRWPGPEERIAFPERNQRQAYWALAEVLLPAVLREAGLSGRTFQNCRATCSSLLKQWGVAPEYVRAAIGHESDAVARAHYDALDHTTYRAPEPIGPGETPMDLFVRLCPEPAAEEPAEESVEVDAQVVNLASPIRDLATPRPTPPPWVSARPETGNVASPTGFEPVLPP